LGKSVHDVWEANGVIQCVVEMQHERNPLRSSTDVKGNGDSPKVTPDADSMIEVIVPGRRAVH
jgi:hypothetical protein